MMPESAVLPAFSFLPSFETPKAFFTVGFDENPVSVEMLKLISKTDSVPERKYVAFTDAASVTAYVVKKGLAPHQLVALFDGSIGTYSFRSLFVRASSADGVPGYVPRWVSPAHFAVKINPVLFKRHPRDLRRPVEIHTRICAIQIGQYFGETFPVNAPRRLSIVLPARATSLSASAPVSPIRERYTFT
jgi:hypothetical protein